MNDLRGLCRAGRSGSSQAIACLLALAVLHAVGCASQPAVRDALTQSERTITDFGTLETAETMAVVVKSGQPLTYSESREKDPRGVSLRFPATRLDGLEAAYFPPANPLIRSIRSGQVADSDEAYVFLELALDASYEVMSDQEGLKIVFRKPLVAAATEKIPALSGVEAPKAGSAPVMTTEASAALLREVHTEVRGDRLVIRVIADGRVKPPNIFTLDNPARIVFDLMGLQSNFQGEQRMPVHSEWVSQIRHHGYPDKVRLVADTDARYLKSYFMELAADGILITVGGPKQ